MFISKERLETLEQEVHGLCRELNDLRRKVQATDEENERYKRNRSAMFLALLDKLKLECVASFGYEVIKKKKIK